MTASRTDTHQGAVLDALQLHTKRGDALANHPIAVDRLAVAVSEHLPLVEGRSAPELAMYLEHLGVVVKGLASDQRPLWGEQQHGVRALASALWTHRVRAEVGPEIERAGGPGISGHVLDDLAAGLRPGRDYEVMSQRVWFGDQSRRGIELRTDDELIDPLIALLERAPSILGSVYSQRLLVFVAGRAWTQDFVLGAREPTRITVPGGWTELARVLGMGGSQKAITQLRAAAEILDYAHVVLGHHRLRLLTLAANSPKHAIVLVAEGPLRPRFTNELKKLAGFVPKSARQIVPLPPPGRLPLPIGGPTTYAAQGLLALLVMRELRAGAEELLATGRVAIQEDRWQLLADRAGLAYGHLDAVRSDWVRQGFLSRSGSHEYDLGRAYALEREMILEGARRSIAGRARRNRGEGKSPKRPRKVPK